jgi:hypothetical protein
MSKRLNISFKDSEEEIKILTAINSNYDKSAFIKSCVKFYLDHKNDFHEEKKQS